MKNGQDSRGAPIRGTRKAPATLGQGYRSQRLWQRRRNAMKKAQQLLQTTAWVFLDEPAQNRIVAAVKDEIWMTVERLIDVLEPGAGIDYDRVAKEAVVTIFGGHMELFNADCTAVELEGADVQQPDGSLVEELFHLGMPDIEVRQYQRRHDLEPPHPRHPARPRGRPRLQWLNEEKEL